MSTFLLKLIAMLTMLIDHSAVALYYSGVLSSEPLYFVMRSVGRIAFPVFCFTLTVGYEKTSDREKYLSRLCAFAVISQLPFSLVALEENYSPAAVSGLSLCPQALLLILPLAVYYVYGCGRKLRPSLLWAAAAMLLGSADLSAGGYVLLSHTDLNVFYTLAVSLVCMRAYDLLTGNGDSTEKAMCALAAIITVSVLQINADYALEGLLLALLLHIYRDSGKKQVTVCVLWCAFMYFLPVLVGETKYIIMGGISMLAPLMIGLYNGRRGPKMRTAFYLVYPVHLGLLAALSRIFVG